MKKAIAILLVLCMIGASALSITCFAEETESGSQLASGTAELQDNLVETRHTAQIRGKEIAYTVTAGTMAVSTGGEQCEFFFRAYTMDNVEDAAKRPITFAFNGGPGSCSYYLEIGCLGPKRVEISDDGHSISLPAKLVDNNNSLLDLTDLVFIDAIGTGYSRPTGESELSAFIGYDNDIRSFGDFIRQYVNRYKRWGSEKYIAGESYGTPRAVGLCKYLSDAYSISINGLMLFSTINDFRTAVPDIGNELPYATYFPTFAADAWYHGMLSDQYQAMTLEEYLDAVREFVSSEYYPALFLGSRMSEADRDALAEKISSYLGLSKDFILEKNLRITLEDFCSHLLRDQNLMIGRNDGRYSGPITAGSLDSGASDPSSIETSLLFGNTYNAYLTEELEYQTDRPYVPMSEEINNTWTSPDIGTGWIGGYFSQEDIIQECMSKNPYLKIWVNCGYYDSATPFYAAEWVYSHVFLNDERKDNLSFSYYPSGHMFYLEKESFDQFRANAEAWFGEDQ